MYGANNMKKSVVFNNQFTPKLGGQFELESGGQFAPELVVNLHWKVVVNLTGFSTHEAAKNIAMYYSFFATCKKNNIKPLKWLYHVLENSNDTKSSKLHNLLPQYFNQNIVR